MQTILEQLQNACPDSKILLNESMQRHTTLQIGGPADLFILPANITELHTILIYLHKSNIPRFLLGSGANIVVADRGIRGAVISLNRLNAIRIQNKILRAEAGASIDQLVEFCLSHEIGGFASFYRLPGTLGGALWMNARCYGANISDELREVHYLDCSYTAKTYRYNSADFSYKTSPFQQNPWIITSATFRIKTSRKDEIRKAMQEIEHDRAQKGHFSAPSAGSVFKNNRAFGKPTGEILDSLGCRGMRCGGAAVSSRHANIIVNTHKASAEDISCLVKKIHTKVKKTTGFDLESEILFVGDWR